MNNPDKPVKTPLFVWVVAILWLVVLAAPVIVMLTKGTPPPPTLVIDIPARRSNQLEYTGRVWNFDSLVASQNLSTDLKVGFATRLSFTCGEGYVHVDLRTGKVELQNCKIEDTGAAFWRAVEAAYPQVREQILNSR